MTPRRLSPEGLRQLLVTHLAADAGASAKHWEQLLGDMIPVAPSPKLKTNWKIGPARGCRLADRITILGVVTRVKAEHPFVRW